MIDRAVLRGSGLFADFGDEALDRVIAVSVEREVRRGDVIFAEQARAEHVYVVTSGRIMMTTRTDIGRESVFGLKEAGDLFGEMAVLDGLGRSAEARAIEPSTIIEIPFEPVRAELERHPELLWGVVALLSGRIRAMDNLLADSMSLDVTGRTAKHLLDLSGGEDEFVLPVTQEELAGMVGASRERVNKAIASFVRLGWIEQSDRNYVIQDREQLRRRSR